MLSLNRKAGQGITFELEDGREIDIVVARIRGDSVKIDTCAPQAVRVMRTELRGDLLDRERESREAMS